MTAIECYCALRLLVTPTCKATASRTQILSPSVPSAPHFPASTSHGGKHTPTPASKGRLQRTVSALLSDGENNG